MRWDKDGDHDLAGGRRVTGWLLWLS